MYTKITDILCESSKLLDDFGKTKKLPILKSLRLGKRSPLITPSCLKRDQIKRKRHPSS